MTSSDYTNWATNSDAMPESNVGDPTLANVANYGTSGFGALPVGSYTNSQSFYGMFEMMGNIAEITETPNGGNSSQWAAMSGSYATTSGSLDVFSLSSLPSVYVNSTASTAQIGFRLAVIPEPTALPLLILIGLSVLLLRGRSKRSI
jgi:formylglycine-generating enzyme required for sulfatase activity